MSAPCRRCKERGQTWNGGAPVCGFSPMGTFDPDNWMCATLNALRDIAEEDEVWNEDQYVGVVPIVGEGEFIILGWYKHRGRTETAVVIDGKDVRPLRRADAERALDIAASVLGAGEEQT